MTANDKGEKREVPSHRAELIDSAAPKTAPPKAEKSPKPPGGKLPEKQ